MSIMRIKRKAYNLLALFIFFIITSCGGGGGGQSGISDSFSWTGIKQTGTSNRDDVYGIAISADGGLYITGYTTGTFDNMLNYGMQDVYIMKYNLNGEKLWIKQYGTSSEDYASGISVDNYGNVYITGFTNADLDNNTNLGYFDAFIIKYNQNGVRQWTRLLGSAGDDRSYGITVSSDGAIYICGWTTGILDGPLNKGGNDIFLAKYDSGGNLQWIRQTGSSDNDEAHGVVVDSNGVVYIVGYTYGKIDGSSNTGRTFIQKYNTNGLRQWVKQYDIGQGIKVAIDKDNYIYIVGNTNLGFLLTKFNPVGDMVWNINESNGYYFDGRGIAIDQNNNLFVAGFTGGPIDNNIWEGSDDAFLMKYDNLGNKKWSRQLGTSGSDISLCVSIDGVGNAYIAGYSTGAFSGNINSGDYDVFIAKYDSLGIRK